MIHQLIFSKLLGEIDYGAQGDFNSAGFVPFRDAALEFLQQPIRVFCCTGLAHGLARQGK